MSTTATRKRANCRGVESCLYCGCELAKRHEHDHAPLPFRHGGDEVFCVCVNCHDLKDRSKFGDLSMEIAGPAMVQLMAAWDGLGFEGRLVAAMVLAGSLDAKIAMAATAGHKQNSEGEQG